MRLISNLFVRTKAAAAVIAAALLICVATAAAAMRVSPMVIEMTTTGSGAIARIEVQNLNQARLPFEIRVTRVDYDENGNATETPADDDFLVFPPQGLVPPGGRQVARIQWVGPPEIPASRSYYFSVNQLPIQLDAQSGTQPAGQVQIVYHMKALVVVAPPNATPNVQATDAHAGEYQPAVPPGTTPPPPVPGVQITLHNSGRRHAMMSALRWVVDGPGRDGRPQQLIFTQDELNRIIGTGYVGPLTGIRTFHLPVPAPFGAGPLRVRFMQ